MLTFFFFTAIIIGLIAAVGTCLEMGWVLDGFFDLFMVGLMALMMAGAFGGAVYGGGTGLSYFIFDHKDHYSTHQLVAIRDTTSIGGEFFLGSGAIGGTGNYVFYYRDGGAKQLVNADGAKVRVYEDTDKPYAIRFDGCDLSWSWVANCWNQGSRWTEIHVPAGSIKEGVNLNLGADK